MSKSAIHNFKYKRRVIREIGGYLSRLHNNGIFHGDLHPNNLLVSETDQGFKISIIDNECVRQYRRIPLKLVIKNLVQITKFNPTFFTRQDRRRFSKAYFEHSHSYPSQTQRRIMAKTDEFVRKRLTRKFLGEKKRFP
ncbi:MAG: lipopolysaccharide kinase InaA family protein [Verrucomicrobia bacterium]|nr:lipopolysaccharide kinase InaA family protein [Verrucomicrobiota bacterium]MCF7709359.1 lipopolysaccharide kinase InaA family protein [Verrucomicrobiota bacterium]